MINVQFLLRESFGSPIAFDYPEARSFQASSNDASFESLSSISTSSKGCSPHKKESLPKRSTYRMKLKTELCKTYSLGFVCPYGDECSFAHGTAELKSKVLVPNRYKTNKCRDFHKTGYCRFGTRCQFLHNEGNSKSHLERMTYTKALEALEINFGLNVERSVPELFEQSLNLVNYRLSRLPIFEEIKKC